MACFTGNEASCSNFIRNGWNFYINKITHKNTPEGFFLREHFLYFIPKWLREEVNILRPSTLSPVGTYEM